jgi:hypothetical protein
MREGALSEETGTAQYGEEGKENPADPREPGPGVLELRVIANLRAGCFAYRECVLVHLIWATP